MPFSAPRSGREMSNTDGGGKNKKKMFTADFEEKFSNLPN